MALPPLTSATAPTITPTAAAVQEHEVVITILEHAEKKFQNSLSLAEAKKWLEELRGKYPRFMNLSPLDLLQFQICRDLETIRKHPKVSRLVGQISGLTQLCKVVDMIEDAQVNALKVFREWGPKVFREWGPTPEMKHQNVKLGLFGLRKLFTHICQCVKPKFESELQRLEEGLGVMHHLSQNNQFLVQALTLLNPELQPTDGTIDSIPIHENSFVDLFHPEAWSFYQVSLSCAHSGFRRFQIYLEKKFHPEFKAALKHLKGEAAELAADHYKNLTHSLDVSVTADFVGKMVTDPANQKIERLLSRITKFNYVFYPTELLPLLRPLIFDCWWPALTFFHVPSSEFQELQKTMMEQHPVLAGMGLSKLTDLAKEALTMKYSCCKQTFRLPSQFIQTAMVSLRQHETVSKAAFHLLTEIGSSFDTVSVTFTDFLIHHSFQIFGEFDPQSESRKGAERALEEWLSNLVGIDTSNFQEGFVLQFRASFKTYVESMGVLLQKVEAPGNFPSILAQLAALMPSESLHTPLFHLKFGYFVSLLDCSLGKSGERDPSPRDIPFLQDQLRYLIYLIAKLVEGRQEQMESILTQLIAHPETSGQSKQFWKLQLKLVKIFFKKYAKAYQFSLKIKDQLQEDFKAYFEGLDPGLNGSFVSHLNVVMSIQADTPEIQKIASLFEELAWIHNATVVLIHPFIEILKFASETVKKKAPENREEPIVKKREEVEEEEPKEIVVPVPTVPYKPTPFEKSLEPLVALQQRNPLPLDRMEEAFSLFKRKEKMEQALQTQLYLMHLLEEQKDPELKPLFRGTTDLFRLHEMTQKLALAFFPIGKPHLILDPNQRHLFTSLHDGVYLAQVLTKSEPLFGNKKSEPFLKDQEKVLKVSYWFSEERPEPNSAYDFMLPRCKEIWRNMEKQKSVELTCIGVVDSLWKMRAFVQQQREEPTEIVFPELPPLRELIGTVEAPVVELATALDTHAKACMRAPILFTNRHLEIQIGLLTSVMKDLLYKRGHSPDQELEGRPLKYSHHVLHLWNLLKSHCKTHIEEQLALFVGDPRYPFPNKTAISHDLVTSYDLSRLLAIARTGFLVAEKVQLFKKYVPDFSVNDLKRAGELIEKRLQDHLERVEKKTRLAFVLAAELLRMQ